MSFRARYQAILCDHESYLLELVRYLHLNPARIRSPLSPWTYRWSSHTAYLGRSSPVQVSTAAVLGNVASTDRPRAASLSAVYAGRPRPGAPGPIL